MQKKGRIMVLIFLMGVFMQVRAQQNHFVYIQTDDKQPFSVKLNNKLYNSTASGYLIIPKLIDGKYQAAIGFPGDKYPEQQFFLLIDKKDIGYSLKNFNEKGWGLFNLQNFAITMNGQDVAGTDIATKQEDLTTNGNQPSAFGNMLSEVTNDSTLTKIQAPISEPKIEIPEPEKKLAVNEIKADSVSRDTVLNVEDIIASNQAIVNQGIPDVSANTAGDTAKTTPAVTTDVENKESMVPAIKDTALNNASIEPQHENEGVIIDTAATKKEIDNPFFKKEEPAADANATNIITQPENPVIHKDEPEGNAIKPAYKQDCRAMIEDNDIEKMKRKMVMQDNNDGMILVAKKYLTNKCITEAQVKAISGLFLSDEGRYLLFDALYGYVYDYGNYPLLEKQLVDEYYRTRFKAMLH